MDNVPNYNHCFKRKMFLDLCLVEKVLDFKTIKVRICLVFTFIFIKYLESVRVLSTNNLW